MALIDTSENGERALPHLGLADTPQEPSLSELVRDVLESRQTTATETTTTTSQPLRTAVAAWLAHFRETQQTYSTDEMFGRHGIREAQVPNLDGSKTVFAYVATQNGGYYRVEQTTGPDDQIQATYLSTIAEDGSLFPAAGLVLEGPFRSTSGPNGSDSLAVDQLPSGIIARMTFDLTPPAQ